MYTEDALVSNIKLREADAMLYMYKKYGPVLYALIFQQLSDKVLTEAVFEKVLLSIIKRVDNFDSSKCRFFTWMCWIVNAEVRQLTTTGMPLKPLLAFNNFQHSAIGNRPSASNGS